MLSKPFRKMSKIGLGIILLLLLVVEGLSGYGLYVNNKTASASVVAQPTPIPTIDRTIVHTVQNFPRTVVTGHYETFSVTLNKRKHVPVVYEIFNPGAIKPTESVTVYTDANGYSQHRFLITVKPKSGQRDTIGIGVYYQGELQVYTRFAVQVPKGKNH